MILVGAWLVILGYGVLYAGVYKLNHVGENVDCGLRTAFTGTCSSKGAGAATTNYRPQQPSSLPAMQPITV